MDLHGLYQRGIQSEKVQVGLSTQPGKVEAGALLQMSWASLGKFLMLTVQLALLVLVIRQFQIESRALYDLALLTLFGFMIHYFLPLRYRLPFFLLLSLTGIGIVLGLPSGAWLVGIGLVLIGICHLPVSFSARVVILLLMGASLAAMRADWTHAPWPTAIWPILGSMFMFRLIVYLYDLRHDNAPTSIWRTLSYFFLLPNVCFPLFPVVDYKTFRRTYYDDEPHQIYQRGMQWMFVGIAHLILYRFVYYYLTIAPSEVEGIGDLVQYLLSNFLLYLRVSGQFHLIIGMLHLFGFNLPKTHHFYFLSSNFNDFWRRINIYWKDFMMKLFYYPAFFKLRKWGTTSALVLSTLFVFLSTWLLHSYQWFWLRGSFPIIWQDALFWGILALLVVANSLYELRRGRERTLAKRSWTFRGTAGLALRTAGTFAVICILWSLWTSDSLSDWVALWLSAADTWSKNPKLIITLLVLGAVVVGGIAFHKLPSNGGEPGKRESLGTFPGKSSLHRAAAMTGAAILLLALTGRPEVYTRLGSSASEVIHALREVRLSKRDAALLERGYYEDLLRVERFNSELWEVYMRRPTSIEESGAIRWTNDFLMKELRPEFETTFKGRSFRTNRWGMRDRDYEMEKSPHTYRIALLGSSIVMGSGVANDETFEALLEERLNRENSGGPYTQHEILNFAVGGTAPSQQLVILEKKVFSFDPDAVFYVAHSHDPDRLIRHLVNSVRMGIDIPYEDLRNIVRTAGIDKEMTELIAKGRLKPFAQELISWVYQRIVTLCRERGVLPVWVFLPRAEFEEPFDTELFGIAAEAGFIVLDLSGVYEHRNLKSLWVAEWDHHPNAKGHQLIADRLYEALRGKAEILRLGLSSQPGVTRGQLDEPVRKPSEERIWMR